VSATLTPAEMADEIMRDLGLTAPPHG